MLKRTVSSFLTVYQATVLPHEEPWEALHPWKSHWQGSALQLTANLTASPCSNCCPCDWGQAPVQAEGYWPDVYRADWPCWLLPLLSIRKDNTCYLSTEDCCCSWVTNKTLTPFWVHHLHYSAVQVTRSLMAIALSCWCYIIDAFDVVTCITFLIYRRRQNSCTHPREEEDWAFMEQDFTSESYRHAVKFWFSQRCAHLLRRNTAVSSLTSRHILANLKLLPPVLLRLTSRGLTKGGSRHLCCSRDPSPSECFFLTAYLDFRSTSHAFRDHSLPSISGSPFP